MSILVAEATYVVAFAIRLLGLAGLLFVASFSAISFVLTFCHRDQGTQLVRYILPIPSHPPDRSYVGQKMVTSNLILRPLYHSDHAHSVGEIDIIEAVNVMPSNQVARKHSSCHYTTSS